MSALFTSPIRFRDGAGVKTQYPLGTGHGGGDGMDFATGAEVFQWSSESVPSGQKPKRIVSLWIDASQLTAGKNLTVSTGQQKIVVPGGSQGYSIISANAPFLLTITTNGGTGTVNVTAYDYNALFTGAAGSNAGIGGGAGTGGSGTGGSGTGTGGSGVGSDQNAPYGSLRNPY